MSRENWKLEKDLCRCCLSEGSFKNLAEPCFNQGEEEVYCEMLLESLDINLVPVSGPLCSSTYTICEECILRLREACSFRRQVLLSEKRFRDLYKRDIIELHLKEEAPDSDNEGLVKFEVPKNEDDDFQMNYDDDDDADNKSTIEIEVPQAKKPKPKKPKAKEKPKQPKKRTGRPRKVETKTEAEAKAEAEAKVEAEAGAEAETVKHKDSIAVNVDYTIKGEGADVKYICCDCGHQYKSLKTLKSHILRYGRNHKKPDMYICDVCKREFTKKGYLIKHLYTHPTVGAHNQPKKSYCRICKKLVQGPMSKHMEKHGVYKCAICSTQFPRQTELVEHEKAVHGKTVHSRGKVFVCHSCGIEIWGRERDMTSHLRTHGLYRCEKCLVIFGDKKLLNAHVDQRHPVPFYTCGICGYKTKSKHTSLAHQRNVHMKEKTIPCPICDKMFFSTSMLNMHMVRHNPVKKYTCRFCEKKFPRSETRRRHERIHTGEKNKVCTICDARFVQKASLSYHLKKYHPAAV